MKRVGNLYSKICEKNNIQKAINKASLRKKDRENVKKILSNQIYYTDLLYKTLKNKEYKPNPYRAVSYTHLRTMIMKVLLIQIHITK